MITSKVKWRYKALITNLVNAFSTIFIYNLSMKKIAIKVLTFLIAWTVVTVDITAQENSIQDLDFLIGTWEVREDNAEKTWWEETTRTAQYTLDSTYIELTSHAVSSTGKERTYRWFIHYNSKGRQYEMVSMFGNWHKVQFDILEWDATARKLTIRSGQDPSGPDEYHERYGELIFEADFSAYTWNGENKYGDPADPGIWTYVEKGRRVKASN